MRSMSASDYTDKFNFSFNLIKVSCPLKQQLLHSETA